MGSEFAFGSPTWFLKEHPYKNVFVKSSRGRKTIDKRQYE
jgi:hypothetical protein